jgi:hypothetical protein
VPDVQYPDEPTANPSTIRIEDLLAGDEAASPSTPVVREGLPRSFRMRADKHYVEMLDTPQPGASKESPVPAASPAVTPASAIAEGPDDEALAAAARAGSDLAQALFALRTSTNLLADRGGLASTVGANLIRAEAWRATCLLQVSRFLRGEIPPAIRPVQARAVIDQVLEAIEAERRLRGVVIDRRINVGERRIATDEQLLVGALSGLLMTMIASSEAGDTMVTFSGELRTNEVAFTLIQDRAAAVDLPRRLTGFTRVAAGIGGAVTMAADPTTRVGLTFRVIQSSAS